jgi:zinc finger CCHC domain-containing protein 9
VGNVTGEFPIPRNLTNGRCNGYDHSLSQCTEPIDEANPTPYATCYICLGSGHISAACPQNSKGVYVNGGNCKVCKSTAHRAKDCPMEKERIEKEGYDFREERRRKGEEVVGEGQGVGADEDDFMGQARVERAKPKPKGKMEKKPPANNSIRGPTKQPEERFVVEGEKAPAAKAKVVKF